jgi:hypothetical protein
MSKITKVTIVVLLFLLVDSSLNVTLYNPRFITPVYSFFLSHHILKEESSGYPVVPIWKLNWNLYDGPRATIVGTVTDVVHSGDGDWHINVGGIGGTVVSEVIPEYPLPIPAVGDRVRIWGVTRYDLQHRWAELHPVIGWHKLK